MKYQVTVCLALLLATMILVYFEKPKHINFKPMPASGSDQRQVVEPTRNFTILPWNTYWNWPDFGFGGFGNLGFQKLNCIYDNCYLIKGKNKIKEADALLIHGHQFENSMVGKLKRSLKKCGQKPPLIVYLNKESPRFDSFNFNELINITMTYRRTSDIFNGYGRFVPISPEAKQAFDKGQWLTPDFSQIKAKSFKKSKDIAWMVSHCETDSKRELIAKKWSSLSNLTMDVYGKCGGMKLPYNLGKNSDETLLKRVKLYIRVLKDYKFYFSFENSLCKDYITEKFFLAFKAGVVPIAYGGLSKEDYEQVVPPHTYIYMEDFETLQELNEYVTNLVKNPKLYEEYFWWRNHYQLIDSQQVQHQAICDLCQLLNGFDQTPLIYQDFESYWNPIGICRKPKESLFFKVLYKL